MNNLLKFDSGCVFIVDELADLKKIPATSEQIIIKNSNHSIYYLGLGYLNELRKSSLSLFAHNCIFICDVDDDLAFAQAALKMGFKYLLFKGKIVLQQKLNQIAIHYEAHIFNNDMIS